MCAILDYDWSAVDYERTMIGCVYALLSSIARISSVSRSFFEFENDWLNVKKLLVTKEREYDGHIQSMDIWILCA